MKLKKINLTFTIIFALVLLTIQLMNKSNPKPETDQ